MSVFDVLIIGGGPAGITAGLYAGRAELKVGMLERLMPGGEVASTEWIENYPGFDEGISGTDLMMRMERQARNFKLEILSGVVEKINFDEKIKTVSASGKMYQAKTIILTTGSDPRKLNVPGETALKGTGVSYCATCDGPFFKDKDIVVVGGGSSGVQESLYLTRFVRSIKLVEFMDHLNAEKILQKRAMENPKFSFYLNHRILEIKGDTKVKTVVVEDRSTSEKKEFDVEGIFIWIGFNPNTDFLKGKLELDQWDFIVTDESMQTSVPGVYAAGDVRSKTVRQITTAVADGTVAAISALNYIERHFEDGVQF
jgi:thioredoxin reductase (NADPH)